MKIFKLLFSLILLSLSSLTFANPNTWQTGFAQGTQEYSIASKDNAVLLLSCNVASGLGHSISVYPKGMSASIEFNSKQHQLFLSFNASDVKYPFKPQAVYTEQEWQTLITQLAFAQQIDIYHENKFLMQLKPSIASRQKLAKQMVKDCNFENLRSAEE